MRLQDGPLDDIKERKVQTANGDRYTKLGGLGPNAPRVGLPPKIPNQRKMRAAK